MKVNANKFRADIDGGECDLCSRRVDTLMLKGMGGELGVCSACHEASEPIVDDEDASDEDAGAGHPAGRCDEFMACEVCYARAMESRFDSGDEDDRDFGEDYADEDEDEAVEDEDEADEDDAGEDWHEDEATSFVDED